MKLFLRISFFLLCFSSCGPLVQFEGFFPARETARDFRENPYFLAKGEEKIFKANGEVYGHSFGGILVLKKTGDSLWRAALLTDFGTTLLDMSYNQSTYKVNYCLEKLNKKIIISTLLEDFRLLSIPPREKVQKKQNKEGFWLYQTKQAKVMRYYILDDNYQLRKLIKTKRRRKKISIILDLARKKSSQVYNIQHFGIPFRLKLTEIPQKHAH